MSRPALDAAFIDGSKGRLFVVVRRARAPARGCVLIVPPFAEEMNKSRRMMTLLATALAQDGITAVSADLHGTGDSDGDFGAADWQTWTGDIQRVAAWCTREHGEVLGIVAIRLGCALASAAFRAGMPSVRHTVFWQPALEGSRALDQFLRLRIAAAMMEDDRKETLTELRQRLHDGETLEVGGYEIAPALAAQLSQARGADAIVSAMGNLTWLEVGREAGAALSVPAARVVDEARARGMPVEAQVIPGPPFWLATEIVEVPQLITATAAVFARAA